MPQCFALCKVSNKKGEGTCATRSRADGARAQSHQHFPTYKPGAMDLILTIIEKAECIGTQATKHVFHQSGGTLGRSAKCSWQFADPERVISNTHVKIDYVGGQYLLVDQSTNGVRLNGAEKPLGKGNHAILSAGDVFQIGGIKFQASFDFGEDSIIDKSFNAFSSTDDTDLFAKHSASMLDHKPARTPVDDYFNAHPGQEASMIMDPLQALGAAAGLDHFPRQYRHSVPHHGVSHGLKDLDHDPLRDAMPFCTAQYDDLSLDELDTSEILVVEHQGNDAAYTAHKLENAKSTNNTNQANSLEIPENWDLSQISGIAPSQPLKATEAKPEKMQTLGQAPHLHRENLCNKDQIKNTANKRLENTLDNNFKSSSKVNAEIIQTNQTHQAQTMPDTLQDTLQDTESLLSALGLTGESIPPELKNTLVPMAAEIVRESLIGLINQQSARRTLKQAHRLNQTTIAPVENNPLKFSASLTDAITALFARHSHHYLTGPQAVKALFAESALHEQAVNKAHQAAHAAVMAWLDPESIQQEQHNKSNSFPFKTKSASHLEAIQIRWADKRAQQTIYDDAFRNTYEKLTENIQ